MRKKFLYVVLVPLALVILLLYFFLDQWVEAGLETAGEAAVGAKVEIDDLRISFSPLGLEFQRLQVANPRDPWSNIFETGRVQFALDVGQLLRNKYIIETVEVEEFILGSERATDGSLPKKPAPLPAATPGEQSLTQQAETITSEKKQSTPVFDLQKLRSELKIDSILNVRNLRSVQHIDTLKNQIQAASRQWQATLNDIEQSKDRLAQIEGNVKAINVQQLKTIDQIAGALKNANEAYANSRQILDTYQARRSSLTSDINTLTGSIKSIDDIVREDFRGLLQLARLPDVNMKGLAELLLGKEILDRANEYLYWVEFTHTKVKNTTSSPANAKPPRTEGQTIYFPSARSFPKFWIKKILISGGTDKKRNPNYFYARGEVLNIASNHKITGFPMTIDLKASQGRGTQGTFAAVIDRTKDVPVDNYRATLAGVPIAAMELGRSDFVPSKITNAQATFGVSVNVPGNQFDANAAITVSGVTVVFDRPVRNTVERLVRDVLESIRAFGVKLRIWKRDGKLDVAFETDLDNLLADRTKKVIGDEIARIRNELKAKLDQKIAAKRQEVERLLNQKKEEVLSRLRAYESLLNEKVALVENKKKELESRIEAEKKKQEDSVKKKAEDALKGLFKKKD